MAGGGEVPDLDARAGGVAIGEGGGGGAGKAASGAGVAPAGRGAVSADTRRTLEAESWGATVH